MENNKEKIELLGQLVDGAETSIRAARQIIFELSGGLSGSHSKISAKAKNLNVLEDGKIIEGVFDGEHMIGPDDKKYPVPANYASKSKLIQGDVLKLTVNADGSFVFKQIGPIERRKVVGTLTYADGEYRVLAESKAYKILFASITYFKVQPGDSVTLILPKDGNSEWGAIENVIHTPEETEDAGDTRDREDLDLFNIDEPLKIEEGLDESTEKSKKKKDDTDISEILVEEPLEFSKEENEKDTLEVEADEELSDKKEKVLVPEKEVRELEI